MGFIYREFYWRNRLHKIGKGVKIFSNVVIHSPDKVEIGDNCSIAEFCHIWGGGGVVIGKDSLIASHVIITSLTHDPQAILIRTSRLSKPVTIGDNVWIGANSIIFPGVCIGRGSVIGAGAVVNKDIPENSIAVGIPAVVIRKRINS